MSWDAFAVSGTTCTTDGNGGTGNVGLSAQSEHVAGLRDETAALIHRRGKSLRCDLLEPSPALCTVPHSRRLLLPGNTQSKANGQLHKESSR